MVKSKIKTKVVNTFETSDGREFDNEQEAEQWQQYLEDIKGVIMLDYNLRETAEVDAAMYVNIKTPSQYEAFNAMQIYFGIDSIIPEPGYWYYDENSYSYKNIESEKMMLEVITEALNTVRA